MLHQHQNKWGAQVTLSSACLQELVWWKSNLSTTLVTRHLQEVEISQHVFSDSSGKAFGGCWKDKHVQSHFSEKQAKLTINTKEMLAVYYTLSSFAHELRNENVLIHCDNSVTVSRVRRLGSSDCLRDQIIHKIYHLADIYNFSLQATWISGKRNKKADFLSRRLMSNPRLEWTLPDTWFQRLLQFVDFIPDTDLFASHLNHKLPRFCSRTTDPHCWHVDAFTISWRNLKIYSFSPFSLISRVLRKIQTDQVQHAMVLVPVHPSSSWFPRFITMSRLPPLLLPYQVAHSLFQPWDHKHRHPLAQNMRLLLGTLSCNTYNIMDYNLDQRTTLRTMDGELLQLQDIPLSRDTGSTFVTKRRKTTT